MDYEELSEAILLVNERPKPLALYFFSRDKEKQRKVLDETSAGGGCINDTIAHFASALPFGGVGASGIGSYHGKASFDVFSHQRSVLKKSFLLDIQLRYPPYRGKLNFVRKLV